MLGIDYLRYRFALSFFIFIKIQKAGTRSTDGYEKSNVAVFLATEEERKRKRF